METRLKALSVHLLTATGAVFSMLAMLAAADGRWALMFFWLIVALVVDGIDGPLARRYKVKENYGVDRQSEITRDPEVKFDIPATPAPAGF